MGQKLLFTFYQQQSMAFNFPFSFPKFSAFSSLTSNIKIYKKKFLKIIISKSVNRKKLSRKLENL